MSDTKNLLVISQPSQGAEERLSGFILPLSLCLGSILGTVIFRFFPELLPLDVLTEMVSSGQPGDPALWLLAAVSWPGLVILIFSTSVLGIYVIPTVFFARGFSLSLCLTGLIASGAFPLQAAALVLLSGGLSTAAVFLMGEDAWRASFTLRRGSAREGTGLTGTQIVFALLLFFLCAVVRGTLVPAVFPLIYTEI